MLAKRNYFKIILLFLIAFFHNGTSSYFLVTNAEASRFVSDFKEGAWYNNEGLFVESPSYTDAPFYINDQGQSFYFSSGGENSAGEPRLGSWNATTRAYHKLTGPLDNLNAVSDEDYKVAIVTKQYYENIKISNIDFSWSGSSQGTQNVYLVYSLDEGQHWQIKQTDNTSSKQSVVFNTSISGNRLLFGILAGYSTNNTYYFVSPQLSYDYEPLNEEEVIMTFAHTIMEYTPCLSDENDLIFANEAIATSLKEQYDQLSLEQQNDFALINNGEHLKRLTFIIEKYVSIPKQTNISPQVIEKNNLFLIITLVMVFLYGAIRKKTS